MPTTETELRLMAAAAIMGLSKRPKNGYRIPAAIGTPRLLKIKAENRFCRMLLMVARLRRTTLTMPFKSLLTRVTPALSMATSVPDPMAMPTRARARAGASLMPSPAMALARRGDSYAAAALDRGVNVFEQLRRREDQLAVPDDISAYRLALEAEREVVDQYRSAAQAETHPEVRRLLNRLARDEQRHVEELESVYDFANAPNHYLAWGEFSNLADYQNFGRDIV